MNMHVVTQLDNQYSEINLHNNLKNHKLRLFVFLLSHFRDTKAQSLLILQLH